MSGWYSWGYSSDSTSAWADAGSSTAGSVVYPIYYYPTYEYNTVPYSPAPPETEEQRQAREQRQAEYNREQERIRKEQEEAKVRAEKLLQEHIGLEAFGELHKVGYLELDSQKHKGRKYRVPARERRLIEVLDETGKVIDRLCVHPIEYLPAGDEILTRILLLKFDEERILKVANHNPVQ